MRSFYPNFKIAGTLFLSLFLFKNASSQIWQTIGTEGFSISEARHADIAVDNNNTPFVAFCDSIYGYKATVMKFDGTNWVTVGSPGFSSGPASHFDLMSLAFDSNNTPYISYEDSSLTAKAVVRKFDGINWVSVGIEGFSTSMCSSVSIAIDSSDTPYVAYKDYAAGGKAMVMKFDGSNWISVGGGPVSSSSIDHTWLRFDSNNNPVISYVDPGAATSANVKRFDGLSWNFIGSPDFVGQDVWYPFLAIDYNDTPYVIYNYVPSFGPYLTGGIMKFDGMSWVTAGASSFPDFIGSAPKMIFDSQNNPYVIYTDSTNSYRATVITFDGTSWVTVGNAGFSDNGIYLPGITIDSNDVLYVSYEDLTFAGKLTVKSFNISTDISSVNDIDNIINIYPNPSSGVLNFELKVNDPETFKNGYMQVIDNSGRIISEQHLYLQQNRTSVNIQNAANGIYILKIITDKSFFYKKIVIQH